VGENDDRTVAGLKATLVRAFEQGDASLAASLYEPGARLLPPGAPVITGEQAVRQFFQRRFDAGSDGGVLETVRLDEYGDVAVEEGRYGRRAGSSCSTAASTSRSSGAGPMGHGAGRSTCGTPTRGESWPM